MGFKQAERAMLHCLTSMAGENVPRLKMAESEGVWGSQAEQG